MVGVVSLVSLAAVVISVVSLVSLERCIVVFSGGLWSGIERPSVIVLVVLLWALVLSGVLLRALASLGVVVGVGCAYVGG